MPLKVTITGGADASGQNYTWTVTNKHTSPIVYVEFPHYHAGLFFAPKGWSTESTALVRVGYKDEPGVCIAKSDSPTAGISAGQSVTFRMGIAPLPTRRGKGTVRVRFADGTEAGVTGVELPQPEVIGDKYAPLIGLGAIFLVWMVVRTVRGAKTRRRWHGQAQRRHE
ncbi:MAG: hypothetical protein WBE26_08045 [Phycisphaerae bacterium]